MANNQPLIQLPDTRTTGSRPSSRRALTAALELAREAVLLDTTNDDPIRAIQAYSRSVALLSEVMERVMRGDDSTESRDRRRGGRRRSVVAREEEVRRLRSIHDTYADRMHILSDIYNVDPNNPTLSRQQESSNLDLDVHDGDVDRGTSLDGNELIGSAMLLPSRDSTSTPDSFRTGSDNTYQTDSLPEFEMVHPPSLQQGNIMPTSPPLLLNGVSVNNPRLSVLPPPRPPPSGPLPNRPRTGSLSNIPPPAPPPRTAPPPPPTNFSTAAESARSSLMPPITTRPRGNSMGHRRTGSDSNRLEALREEPDPFNGATDTQDYEAAAPFEDHDEANGRFPVRLASIPLPSPPPPPPPSKDTPPPVSLPSNGIPPQSPASSSPSTPRNNTFMQAPHPFAIAHESPVQASRARGVSTPTLRSEAYGQNGQISLPPGAGSSSLPLRQSKSSTGTLSSQTSSQSSPTEPVPVAALNGTHPSSTTRVNATSSLPAPSSGNHGGGRNRSTSQPPRPMASGANPFSEFGLRQQGLSGTNSSASQATLPRKPSFPSRFVNQPTQIITSPQSQTSAYFPSSPLPPNPPSDPLRKPYHLMTLLLYTMKSKTGGYITRRLHVPHEVWSQGGAKLLNLPEKVRVLEVLSGALEEIQTASNELTSGLPVSSSPGVQARNDLERWIAKLDEWNNTCEGIVASIGKKLGVGEGFGSKKGGVTSWSGKFARSFDRMTNGKNLDSPASYVLGLTKVFHQAQILDEHTKALLTSPSAPLYASLSSDVRQALEIRLKRSSEFFASVVLTFVIRDLSQLLDKYVKKGEKWLAE